jgi:type IV fimbrial biogenesis protein FimT
MAGMQLWSANLSFQYTQQGFGLIEQIVVLVVVAVIAAMAVPEFRHLLNGHELRSAQTDYIAALQHARNLAVNEQVRVIFCPSRNALTCNGSSSWNDGWLIGRADPQNKGQLVGSPLYVGGRYRDALIITGSTAKKYIWFDPDGSAAGTNQSLFLCVRNEPKRVLVVRIALRGRVKGDLPQSTDNFDCGASA